MAFTVRPIVESEKNSVDYIVVLVERSDSIFQNDIITCYTAIPITTNWDDKNESYKEFVENICESIHHTTEEIHAAVENVTAEKEDAVIGVLNRTWNSRTGEQAVHAYYARWYKTELSPPKSRNLDSELQDEPSAFREWLARL